MPFSSREFACRRRSQAIEVRLPGVIPRSIRRPAETRITERLEYSKSDPVVSSSADLLAPTLLDAVHPVLLL
jgi:hypothetical protein